MARMTFDAIRAADFVESLPNVDKNRIGCIGHSLGGKMALYAPAFDERYKASVSSEGGIGLKFSNWDAIWYLGPRIKDSKFKLENHQVLSLIAPRAFLLLAGDSSDSDKSWTVAVADVDKATWDLSVKNPNAPEVEPLHSPEQIIADMLARDEETARILEEIRGML